MHFNAFLVDKRHARNLIILILLLLCFSVPNLIQSPF